jgi:hypothetical protein
VLALGEWASRPMLRSIAMFRDRAPSKIAEVVTNRDRPLKTEALCCVSPISMFDTMCTSKWRAYQFRTQRIETMRLSVMRYLGLMEVDTSMTSTSLSNEPNATHDMSCVEL